MVPVAPGEPALGLALREALRGGHPLQRGEVQLPGGPRVRAAAGEVHQGPVVGGPQHARPLPHPRDVLLPRQGVDVDEDLPLRLGRAVGLPGGATPYPAGVVGVGPEAVEVITRLPDEGDAVGRLERLLQPGVQGGVLRVGPQAVLGGGAARRDPVHGRRRLDLLQPAAGVGVGGLRRCGCVGHGTHPITDRGCSRAGRRGCRSSAARHRAASARSSPRRAAASRRGRRTPPPGRG